MRDCPRLGRGRFHMNTPAISFIPVDTPRAQSARGGGQAGSGRLRGRGPTRWFNHYDLAEANTPDGVVTGTILLFL